MSTRFHSVTHVSLPKFATKVDLSVLLRNEKNSWGEDRSPDSLRSCYANAVWISIQKWEKLSVSLYISAAPRTSGSPEALCEHSVQPSRDWSSSQGWPEFRPVRRPRRSPPRSHLCQDTNSHKTKQYKNKRSTVKNPDRKICLPGTQTWANTSLKFALGSCVYWILEISYVKPVIKWLTSWGDTTNIRWH